MIFEDISTVLAIIARQSGGDDAQPQPLITKTAGETVIQAGEEGGRMFVIQSGEAEILNEGVVFERVGPGGVVGEMALVDGSLRSATVRAHTALRLLPISKSDFEALIRQHPEFGLHVMKIMSLRLRLMNTRFGDAVEDIRYRSKMESELRALATRDPLTGVSNRQHFHELASREIERAQRHGRALSVAMLDVDHFKTVNDTYGHACGDMVLRQVVGAMGEELRATDMCGRLGGEEFALLLPETELSTGAAIADRIRSRISGHALEWDGQPFSITASIGVAAWGADEASIDPVLARADKGLYAAKGQGRNCVVTAES